MTVPEVGWGPGQALQLGSGTLGAPKLRCGRASSKGKPWMPSRRWRMSSVGSLRDRLEDRHERLSGLAKSRLEG
jgi:hypothetical protein